MGNTGLRTSLIWHDEVMGDVVHDRPARVTIGSAETTTFTTPDVGTQAMFTMFTPGKRGYLLTLAAGMRGTVCLGGVEHEVGALVAASGEPFHATSLGEADWGVVELGPHHKLFFQFVPLEEAEWNLGHPMVLAAVGGFALSCAALTAAWWWKGVPLGEAAFRAGSVSSLAIGLAAIVRWVLRQDNESRASLAFSVLVHAALLFATFQLVQKDAPFEWPKQPTLAGGYMVKLDDPKPPTPVPAVKPTVAKPGAAAPVLPPRQPWIRPKGKKVDKPTQAVAAAANLGHDETPGPGRVPGTKSKVPDVGVLSHEDVLRGILGRTGAADAIAKVQGIGGDPGRQDGPPGAGGPGTTVGGKRGPGPAGEQKGTGDLTVKLRPSVCIGDGCGGGGGPTVLPPNGPTEAPGPTLDKEDISRVIKAHRGMFEACYQKQFDRNPRLAGDVTMHFEITADGRVKGARAGAGSLGDPTVSECMTRALGILKFPARGGAIVNYPFVFSAGR